MEVGALIRRRRRMRFNIADPSRGEGREGQLPSSRRSRRDTRTAVAGGDPVHSPSARRLVDKCLEHPLGTSPPLGFTVIP